MDPLFKVEVLSQTTNPQQVIYAAMHQDYAEGFVWDDRSTFPDESKAGDLVIRNLLGGNRGHFGPLEHPQMVLNCGWFPHSTMQQIRTHRVGVSFDVQCLAGDTEVTFLKTSGSLHKISIAELYDLWTHGEKAVRERKIRGRQGEEPGEYRRDCKKRLRRMKLRVLNEATGAFELSHIQDVMCSGEQPVYRVTMADGKTLDCTANHRLFTTDGWQHMGDALGLVTDESHQVLAMTKACEVMCNGLVRTDALYSQKPWFVAQATKGLTGPKLMAHPVKVVHVEFLGIQTTYDLEVAGQWHNFVANGVVVHNSFRYTGGRIVEVAEGKTPVEEVFYLRPLGFYTDRNGKKYEYTEDLRQEDIAWCLNGAKIYAKRISQGFSEEHARSLIPFDVRQHWVMSANVRSLMHLMDLRAKDDAQLECQHLCELIFPHFEAWVPAVAAWYQKNRWGKARLSP
jgi:thymidylate synthase (FAD)